MGYLIAAYAIGVGGVLFYAVYIRRERRALQSALAQAEESNPG
jgi:hypothetical protein